MTTTRYSYQCQSLLAFTAVLVLLAAGAAPAETGEAVVRYYNNGAYTVENAGIVRAREEAGELYRANLWRENAAFVGAIEASDLRPAVVGADVPTWYYSMATDKPVVMVSTGDWEARYAVTEYTATTATVEVSVNRIVRNRLDMQKPFGQWWYITNVADAAPMGAGPAAKNGVQMLPARSTLLQNDIGVSWEAQAKTLVADGPYGDAEIPLGSPSVVIAGRPQTGAAAAMLVGGQLYAPEDILGQIIALNLIARERREQ